MSSFLNKLKKGMKIEKIIGVEEEHNHKNNDSSELFDEKNSSVDIEKEKKTNSKHFSIPKNNDEKENFSDGFIVESISAKDEEKKSKPKKSIKQKESLKKRRKEKTIKIKAVEKEPDYSEKKEERRKWFKPEGELTIDMYQTDENIVIQSAIAGVTANDIDILIENDMVVIQGERREPFEKDKKEYFFRECYWGTFLREVILPEEVDNSRVEASLKNGILVIKMPKIERNRKRKIKIVEE